MGFLRWFNCWMFGHTPDDDTTGFVEFVEIGFMASICTCCRAIIIYDEQKKAWVKW